MECISVAHCNGSLVCNGRTLMLGEDWGVLNTTVVLCVVYGILMCCKYCIVGFESPDDVTSYNVRVLPFTW